MSIATDVARIKGNITAALAAIADKGVTVPDGSTSDALAGLIAAIDAGVGGGKIATGTYVSSDTTYSFVFKHSLGVLPNLIMAYTTASIQEMSPGRTLKCVMFYNKDGTYQTTEEQFCLVSVKDNSSSSSFSAYVRDFDVLNGSNSSSVIYNLTEESVSISPKAVLGSGKLAVGCIYNIIAAVI